MLFLPVQRVNAPHCKLVSQEKTSYTIAGIDPGLASGGVAVIRSPKEEVLAAASLVEARGAVKAAQGDYDLARRFDWGDKEFSVAAIRAGRWVSSLVDFLDNFEREFGPIDIYAVESFVDQRSRAREEKQRLVRNRWQTPLVMGLLQAALSDRQVSVEAGNLVYQNAGLVITQQRDEIARMKQGDFIPGNELIKNDHQRKALAHALALSLRLNHNPEMINA